MENFITIKENIVTEIEEKKSKFIASLFYIDSQEEAEEIIKRTKKKYIDSRHNCIAYRVINDRTVMERSSDDGEPSGTAGAPMLNILQKKNLCNVLVVVTRYFGGVLLGTGGLVRAYSDSTLKAIGESLKVEMISGYEIDITLDYNYLENFKYYCKNNNINIINLEYDECIFCKIELDDNTKQKLLEDFEAKKINLRNIKVLSRKNIVKSIVK